jgi:uncharacterized protein (DUF433 family)
MAATPLESMVYKDPEVCGGDACIDNTRIMVWLLVAFKRDGMSDEDLLRNYPTLKPEHLVAAWEYARRHPQEIEDAIARDDRLNYEEEQ